MSEVIVNFQPPVKSISIENLISQRDGILKRLASAIDLVKECATLSENSGISGALKYRGFDYIMGGPDHYRGTGLLDEKALSDITKRVDASAWQNLLSESGIRTLMDATARKEWDDKIEKCEVPELTADNIRSTFGMLYDTRDQIFERGVIACFRQLSWHYKSNRPFAFGKKLVMRFIRGHVSGKAGGTSLGWVNMRSTDQLDDLSRVLHVLDGKPEPDHRQGWYGKLNHVNTTTEDDAENDYIRVKCFRNGNGHVYFKRPDLVTKMNRILAKHYPAMLPCDGHEEATSFEPAAVV